MKRASWNVPMFLSFLLFLAVSAPAADPLPRTQPESVGLSSERLDRITQVLRTDIDRGRMPGAVLAIARKGRLAYYESFGYLDKTAGTPMAKDAIFAIASMTKPMVGVGIMQLVEESRVAMRDPASRWIPALGKLPVAVVKTDAAGQTIMETMPAKREMTIHDLLRHTSGLTYGQTGTTPVHKLYPANSATAGANLTGPEFIEQLSKAALLHQPGTAWEYGFSTDVLGLVIEAETGQMLDAFLQERLWKPLGMMDTGFIVPPEKAERYAKALPNNPDTGKPQTFPDRTRPVKFECGGGCAVSTAADYVRFAQMLLNRGKLGDARILGAKTVDYMTADHLDAGIQNNVERTDPTRAGYSFGLTMAVRPATGGPKVMGSPGDYSWAGATGTNFWVDPKEQLVVVFMAATPGPIRWHYRQVINALVFAAIVD
jgi:CubicO group peptidase (beta-lactamase class C family)